MDMGNVNMGVVAVVDMVAVVPMGVVAVVDMPAMVTVMPVVAVVAVVPMCPFLVLARNAAARVQKFSQQSCPSCHFAAPPCPAPTAAAPHGLPRC